MVRRGSSEGEAASESESGKKVEGHPRSTESRRTKDFLSRGRIRREKRSLKKEVEKWNVAESRREGSGKKVVQVEDWGRRVVDEDLRQSRGSWNSELRSHLVEMESRE